MTVIEALLTGGGASTFTVLAGKFMDKIPLFQHRRHMDTKRCPHPNEVRLVVQEEVKKESTGLSETMVRIEKRVDAIYLVVAEGKGK